MKTATIRAAAIAPFVLATAACSSAPGQSVGTTSSAISEQTIVSRGLEWVDAKLHYCQSAHGRVDGDSACWAWEGSSHVCDRESNSAWNDYRSDCSGFVTWSWGLPPVGDGGYVTSDFAPFSTAISYTINGEDLRPGDALNLTADEHIVLFEKWVDAGHSAVFMEEPGCSADPPYAHEFTSNVSISGDEVYIDYEGGTFYAIRYNGSDGSGGGGGTGTKPCELAGHSYAQNTCTETQQCDDGTWTARSDDPSSCKTDIESGGDCLSDSGAVIAEDTCTSTLQCDNGVWVDRSDDPTACKGSSSGSTSCTLGGHTYGQNTCTETLQCDAGHWVSRPTDPSSCDKGVEPSGECITDSGSVVDENTCTSTLQCDDGVWVDREDDPTACR